MATLEELVVSLVAETSGLRAELDKATKATVSASDKMEKAVKDFTENSSKSLSFWESALATTTGFIGSQAVLGAFNMLKDGVKFVGEELLKGAESAIAEQNALTKLANSLALTGQYSQKTAADLAEFAGTMERQTGIADDVVASNLSVLSSLTKLNGEGLKQAQQAAIDLSAAMGIDLNAATLLVGKGVAGNTSAFTRYGFAVQQGANSTENLSNILKALSGVQGAAAGAMFTFDGGLTKVKNSYGNLIEQYSTAIIQNDAFAGALAELSNVLDGATDSAKTQDQQLKILAGETLVGVIQGIAGVVVAFDAVGRAAGAFSDIVQTAFVGLGMAVTGVLKVFNSDYETAFNAFSMQADEVAKNAAQRFSGDTFLSGVSEKLFQIGDAAEQGLGRVVAGANSTIVPTVAATAAVKELSAAEVARNEALKSFATTLAEQGAALDAEYAYELEAQKLLFEQKLVTEEEYYATRNEMLLNQQATEQAQLDMARANQLITDQQYISAKGALEKKQHLDALKLASEKQKADETFNKQRVADLNSTFGTIATLQSSSSKELASIGKAAAIAQATIDGYAAVQKALSAAPPPFNFALAALVGVATAQNISKIKSVGMNDGGLVPGSGPNRDSVPAVLTPGESVINREDTQRLSRFLDQAEGGGGAARIELVLSENLIEFVEARILERQRIGVSILGTV